MKKSKIRARERNKNSAKSAEDRISEAEARHDSEMMDHLTKRLLEKRQELADAPNTIEMERILRDSAHEAGVWINIVDNGAGSGLEPDDPEPSSEEIAKLDSASDSDPGMTNAETCSRVDAMVGTMFCIDLLKTGIMTDQMKYSIAVFFSSYRACGLTDKQAIGRMRVIFSAYDINPDENGVMEAIAEACENRS